MNVSMEPLVLVAMTLIFHFELIWIAFLLFTSTTLRVLSKPMYSPLSLRRHFGFTQVSIVLRFVFALICAAQAQGRRDCSKFAAFHLR